MDKVYNTNEKHKVLQQGGYKIRDQYGLHFLTFTIVGWVDMFTRKECKDIMMDSFRYCQKNKGLELYAYVIMPSHVHIIARAKEGSDGLSAIVRDMKKFTSKELIDWIKTSSKESRSEWLKVVFSYHARNNARNQSFQIWKQDNQPKELLHPRFMHQKLDYIHNNPVVDGIVERAEDYLNSSARNYVGGTDTLIDVELIDMGVEVGYVMT